MEPFTITSYYTGFHKWVDHNSPIDLHNIAHKATDDASYSVIISCCTPAADDDDDDEHIKLCCSAFVLFQFNLFHILR